jgi:anti-sigma B factor antagonist
MADQLFMSVSTIAACTVMALSGESDVNTVGFVLEFLATQVAVGERQVVDLSGLEFMDCAGTQELLQAHQALLERGRSMALACPGRVVARVLQLTGVDQRIPVYSTMQAVAPATSARLVRDDPAAGVS